MRPVQCYFWFIYVYSVLSLQICGASMLLIAGWLFAHGSISWQSSLFIKGVALTVVPLVVGFLTLLEGPFTVSQVCFLPTLFRTWSLFIGGWCRINYTMVILFPVPLNQGLKLDVDFGWD